MSQEPPEKMMFQLSLRRRGISDQTILRTMEEVPREVFVT
ncbi:MAG: protein-L-isoaspartate(D-aspartate) O-methyltransferase, partial [Bradyrhizobium sp.]